MKTRLTILAALIFSGTLTLASAQEKTGDTSDPPTEAVRRADYCLVLVDLIQANEKSSIVQLSLSGVLASLFDRDVEKILAATLRDPQSSMRRLAAETLARTVPQGDAAIHETLITVLNETDPRALAAIYRALGSINAEGAADILVNALAFDEGKNKEVRTALVTAIEATGKSGIDRLLALADSGSDKDLERVLEVYPALRTRAAGEGLIELVKNYHVPPAQKATLIRSYANFHLDPSISLEPLEKYLKSLTTRKKGDGPMEAAKIAELLPVRLAAMEILRGQVVEFLVVGPFDGSMDAAHGPEKNCDPNSRFDPKTGQATTNAIGVTWQPRQAEPNDGTVELAPLFSGPKVSAYALAFVHSPKSQPAKLFVEGSAVARYWLNGKQLLDFAPCCGADPIPVTLQEGWNTVLVRVFATKEEMAFALRVIGGEGLRFATRKD
ncbi:MAG: HEAT repeat domain-containing protein [Planctomycetes bacterium]|nr:HEAT repeat domain-containing protein [Planctomycetota bacterium]